jgi:DNA polymerase-3 subunit alpha
MKAVFKDVARVYEIDPQTANKITKLMPEEAHTFDETLIVPEINEFFAQHPDIKKYCEVFAGLPRVTSQHPAGIVILPDELDVTDIIPVKSAKQTETGNVYNCSQYCKEEVDLLGGIKYDILRLKNIDVLVEELNMINKYYDKNYTQMSIPLNDKKTWDFICEATYLKGIFQMDGMSAAPVIKKIQPHDMEALSAVNAFIRPGTSGLDEYVAAKKDPSKIRLMGYKPFDDVLAPTMGGIVYQEQVMSLISILFNISFGESDLYRRALEKPDKKKNKKTAQYFYDNAEKIGLSNGIPHEACKKVIKEIVDNSAYLFNKSHSIDVYVSYKHVASYRKIG